MDDAGRERDDGADEAEDGAAALAKLKGGGFDFVVSDINMPNMNGWDFIDKFRELKGAETIPTFIFTSAISQKEIEKAKLYSCIKGVILKPLCIQKLNKILRLMDVECMEPFEKVFIPHVHSSYYLNTGTGI